MAWRVARIAATPVASVDLKTARESGPSAGRVVLGVNGIGGPRAAVAYAFAAAARRKTGLTVMVPAPEWPVLVQVEGPLQRFMRAYPDVDVRSCLVQDTSSDAALVAESRAAALLVIGARPQGRIQAAVFGSVARIVRLAQSPVAIIKSPPTGTAAVGD